MQTSELHLIGQFFTSRQRRIVFACSFTRSMLPSVPAVIRPLLLQLMEFRIMNKVSLSADRSLSSGDLFKLAAFWWFSIKLADKWAFVFHPAATLLRHSSFRSYSFSLGEKPLKTTGSDVCAVFSALESSYLGPSVGGELRCVKWEEEKPFYWLINQICGVCVCVCVCQCVWVGEHSCCYTNRGKWCGGDTKKGLLMASLHNSSRFLTSFAAPSSPLPRANITFWNCNKIIETWKRLLNAFKCWFQSGECFFFMVYWTCGQHVRVGLWLLELLSTRAEVHLYLDQVYFR